MIVLDGDDALIGKYVLKFLNSQYQKNDYWYIYTTFIMPKFGNIGFSGSIP